MTTTTMTAEDLIQMLANARKTYYGALGHGKTWHNQLLMDDYRKTLEGLGVDIPSNDELDNMGKFNGKGSY